MRPFAKLLWTFVHYFPVFGTVRTVRQIKLVFRQLFSARKYVISYCIVYRNHRLGFKSVEMRASNVPHVTSLAEVSAHKYFQTFSIRLRLLVLFHRPGYRYEFTSCRKNFTSYIRTTAVRGVASVWFTPHVLIGRRRRSSISTRRMQSGVARPRRRLSRDISSRRRLALFNARLLKLGENVSGNCPQSLCHNVTDFNNFRAV